MIKEGTGKWQYSLWGGLGRSPRTPLLLPTAALAGPILGPFCAPPFLLFPAECQGFHHLERGLGEALGLLDQSEPSGPLCRPQRCAGEVELSMPWAASAALVLGEYVGGPSVLLWGSCRSSSSPCLWQLRA